MVEECERQSPPPVRLSVIIIKDSNFFSHRVPFFQFSNVMTVIVIIYITLSDGNLNNWYLPFSAKCSVVV